MSHIKNMLKHPQAANLHHLPDDLRWATPEIVADYRAERLKCGIIADLGCGIGFQAFAFAKTCTKVYAVELDVRKLECARKNATILGLQNIKFIQGDILDPQIISGLADAEIIFCDPERLPEETTRELCKIKPDVQKLIEQYQKITPQLAIEFPPQIKEIPFRCEREYLSVQGKLNRLTLYFGKLMKAERRAVMLPEKAVLQSGKSKVAQTKRLEQYLLEVNPAVVKAEVVGELCEKYGVKVYFTGKNTYGTSSKRVLSPFWTTFKVLQQLPFQETKILSALQKEQAGNVILRYDLEPEEYWPARTRYERNLRGSKTLCLFRFQEKAVIAERVSPS